MRIWNTRAPRAQRRRLYERHIELEPTEAQKEHLVATGYDPSYGARPLKRPIQKELVTMIGKALLSGKVRDGAHVLIDYDDQTGSLTTGSRLTAGTRA